MSGIDTVSGVHPASCTTSSYLAGKWGDVEKAFSSKKRRTSSDTITNEKDNKVNSVGKTNMNKKCVQVQQNDSADEEEDKEETRKSNYVGKGGAKKRGRSGAHVEGSGCSRGNGRGWRFCQPTLVGYSLCEHPLGKVRLRSMNTYRCRSLGSSNSAPENNDQSKPLLMKMKLGKQHHVIDDNADEHEDKKPLVITKKEMKLGMIKLKRRR